MFSVLTFILAFVPRCLTTSLASCAVITVLVQRIILRQRDALRVLQCGALLAVLVVVNAQPHVNKVCRACYGI